MSNCPNHLPCGPVTATRTPGRPARRSSGPFSVLLAVLATVLASCDRPPPLEAPTRFTELTPGLGYTNTRVAAGPWSIHTVRMDRTDPRLTLRSVHALGGALGLSPLSDQIRQLPTALGTPLVAVNGDFYRREGPFAGDPRGLQVVEGELLSAPNGGVSFWVDDTGTPHTSNVISGFQVTWPGGATTPFGVNELRGANALVLYSAALGSSTRTSGGREWVLEPKGAAAGQPLRLGTRFPAQVLEVREQGDSTLQPGRLILSAGPTLARSLPNLPAGSVVELSTETLPEPGLQQVRTAISGGPVLVRNGRRQKIERPRSESYEFSSMLERHPRTAIGWNEHYFFLVQVDGRQPGLSVGMSLEELGDYLVQLGCTDALNLDGGGSATLWCDGRVRNSPCDGTERPIANALVVLQTPSTPTRTAK